jgi:fructose-bisphosphate aldolase class 1
MLDHLLSVTDEEALEGLNECNKVKGAVVPWRISFSFGRAILDHPRAVWQGKVERVKLAQAAFLSRCRDSLMASLGKLGGDDVLVDNKDIMHVITGHPV